MRVSQLRVTGQDGSEVNYWQTSRYCSEWLTRCEVGDHVHHIGDDLVYVDFHIQPFWKREGGEVVWVLILCVEKYSPLLVILCWSTLDCGMISMFLLFKICRPQLWVYFHITYGLGTWRLNLQRKHTYITCRFERERMLCVQ